MIIGEAPGHREDTSGRPFVGRAGQLLEELLLEQDIVREDAFITNAVSCRPPDNRTPSKAEIKTCKKWLNYQFDKVKPRYVLLLGNTALLSITGKAGIKSQRGKPFEKDGIVYLPTYHPAFILRDETQRPLIENDIALFRRIIDNKGIPREKSLDFVVVTDNRTFNNLLDDLVGTVSFDLETTGLYPWAKGAKINSIGFGTRNKQYIIPLSKFNVDEVLHLITQRLEDCYVVAHNGKFDLLWMLVYFGVRWACDFDTMLASYILNENRYHDLKGLAQSLCGAPNWDIDSTAKQQDNELTWLYQAHDLYYTRKLRFIFGKELAKDGDVQRVYEKLMMPLLHLFVGIEYEGVYIDESKFDQAETYLKSEITTQLTELNKFSKINWGSTQQVSRAFKRLNIPVIETTPTGAPSTNESVLKRIDHPVAGYLLLYRAAKQQLSFFIDGWKPFLCRNRLHPSFKLHGTVTGRPSCEHPNLQQVPRDERIRSLITAPPLWVLVECDLSQIELRIAAELANETNMLMAFANGIDVHWLTAIREIERGGALRQEVLSTTGCRDYSTGIEALLKMGPDKAVEINKAWKEHRKKAKAINFGYLYGMWWKKFKLYARDTYGVIVSDQQAQDSRKVFFNLYPKFVAWHDRQRRFARLNGYVTTMTGRKRRLPEAQSNYDDMYRREAERQAINSPVQGFAAELNLMAALQVSEEFSRDMLRVVGTIHDSILMIVKKEHVEHATRRLLEIMRHPKLLDIFEIEIGVPIEAEAKIGNWSQGVNLDKWLRQ